MIASRRAKSSRVSVSSSGRRYTEDYASFDEALAAALALEHEPRERAEAITSDGQLCADRARIEQLAREAECEIDRREP